MKNILVIAPHPDDEVLGCGGTIAKHNKQGDKTYLCIVTKAYPPDWSKKSIKNRTEEIKKADKILGVQKTYFLDFPTAKEDTIPQKELNDALCDIVNKVKPNIMYIPHKGDLHKGHRLIFEASLVAAKPQSNFSIKKLLSYETLSETEWGAQLAKNINEVFIPNVYTDISDSLEDKLKAMSCYKSELKKSPHPRSLEIIEALAKKRGSEAGLKFAEAFMLIREILT